MFVLETEGISSIGKRIYNYIEPGMSNDILSNNMSITRGCFWWYIKYSRILKTEGIKIN